MVRIEWTERSLEDLKEIHDYIARDSKSYANLFIKKLYDTVQKLNEFPNIGRIVPELNIQSSINKRINFPELSNNLQNND